MPNNQTGSPAARYVVGSRPHKNFTPDLIQRLRIWLDDCQDNHETCPRRHCPLLPTRVVDIGDGVGSPIRLQSNQSGSRGQYAALSYCWGGDQPYKTTMSNINSYTQELASITFPKTLSDAIKVCHEIGIRYIWIDALCIVQDDPKDKASEISQMGRTYKDATLTIMAASARSVYEGFLGDAKIDAPEAKLPFHLNQDAFGAIFVRGSPINNSYFLDEEPIFNRAWTLQEMMLSSRIIMFDSYQATLKCGRDKFWPAMDTYLHPQSRISCIVATEVDTLQDFHLERLAKEYREQPLLAVRDTKGFTKDGHSTRSKIWTTVMAEFSRRDLSVLDDRYPALAGITEELQKIWGGEFVAGFWKDSLVDHLSWVGGVCSDEQFAGRKWEQRLEGPSWSWMSHPSSVSIDPLATTDVKVLGCETELAFPDQPFGPLKWGSLALEARTLPLSALRTKNKLRPNINSIWKRAVAIFPMAMDGIALDFPERGLPDGDLKALVLGMTFSNSGAHCVIFLVLHRLECDTYERIGHAVLHTEFNEEESIAIMSQAEREVVVME